MQSPRGLSVKQENTCARDSFLIKLQAKTVAHVFSYEFFQILRTPFFRAPTVATSGRIHCERRFSKFLDRSHGSWYLD